MSTPLAIHVEKWGKGCGSELCTRPKIKVCIGRGQAPADVLFVGEAPGVSENALGIPFEGPAGKLLDRIILRGLGGRKFAITNLVGCMPAAEDGSGKSVEPPDDACIEKCKPRLQDFIRVVNPKIVVSVGNLAKDWLEQGYRHSIKLTAGVVELVHISHPAWILRQAIVQQGFEEKKCVVTLQSAIRKVFNPQPAPAPKATSRIADMEMPKEGEHYEYEAPKRIDWNSDDIPF